MYRLNLGQQSIVDLAADIAERVIKPNAALADAEGRYPRASMEALGAAGLLGLTIAKEHGGLAPGPACDVRGPRPGGAALRLDRDVLQHASGRDRRLSGVEAARRSTQLRAAARGEHVSDPRVQRVRLAQPLLGAR